MSTKKTWIPSLPLPRNSNWKGWWDKHNWTSQDHGLWRLWVSFMEDRFSFCECLLQCLHKLLEKNLEASLEHVHLSGPGASGRQHAVIEKLGAQAESRGVQRPISLQYQIYPPSSPNIWYFSNWNASPRSWSGWKEMQICKYRRKFREISVKKWPSRLGEIGGAGGETGGRESEGRSDLIKFLKLFQNGRIWSSYMTESNSVKFFNVDFFWLRNRPPKLKYHFFRGSFPQPTSKSKWVGEPD